MCKSLMTDFLVCVKFTLEMECINQNLCKWEKNNCLRKQCSDFEAKNCNNLIVNGKTCY